MQNEFHYLNALVIYISTRPTHFAKNFKRPHRIQDSQEKNDFIALVSEIGVSDFETFIPFQV